VRLIQSRPQFCTIFFAFVLVFDRLRKEQCEKVADLGAEHPFCLRSSSRALGKLLQCQQPKMC
jgi:hypothetical protein